MTGRQRYRASPLPTAAPVGRWRRSRAPRGVRQPRYRSAENRQPLDLRRCRTWRRR